MVNIGTPMKINSYLLLANPTIRKTIMLRIIPNIKNIPKNSLKAFPESGFIKTGNQINSTIAIRKIDKIIVPRR